MALSCRAGIRLLLEDIKKDHAKIEKESDVQRASFQANERLDTADVIEIIGDYEDLLYHIESKLDELK